MASCKVLEHWYTNPDYEGMKDKEIRACITRKSSSIKELS